MEGLVTKSTGSWYQVLTDDGQKYDCRIKGIFRTKGITTTNPIAVGDRVDFELEPEQETGVIHHDLRNRKYFALPVYWSRRLFPGFELFGLI